MTLPTAGLRIDESELEALRQEIVELARTRGYPMQDPGGNQAIAFDGECARILHEKLQLSPHAASDESGWTYLTCCWLLDVAVWRYGRAASERRFIGDVNRNTFRRLWWRAEILGPDIDLSRLQEDELVGLMERPRLSRDRRLTRAVVTELLTRVDAGAVENRMFLMRETSKRLLRLTPFVMFGGLTDAETAAVVKRTFDAASNTDASSASAADLHDAVDRVPPEPSSLLTRVQRVVRSDDDRVAGQDSAAAVSIDALREAAVRIATSTGQVTNAQLRSQTDLDELGARQILAQLVRDGHLARRGVAKGTHYVVPAPGAAPETDGAELDGETVH